MKFKSITKKGNNKGVGFVILPENSGLNKGDTLIVKVLEKDIEFYASARIYYKKLGFYISSKIMNKKKLLGESFTFSVENVDGFHTKIGYDGRIYLPNRLAKENNVRKGDCLLIEGIIGSKVIKRYCQVGIRKKERTVEFKCQFSIESRHQEGIFRIIQIVNPSSTLYSNNDTFSYEIDERNAIVFRGKMSPAIVKKSIHIEEFAHYMGCYFADGTKKGNSWAISASTFKQAVYYLKKHKEIVLSERIEKTLSLTVKEGVNIESLKNSLKKKWLTASKINIERFRIHKSINYSNRKTKRNPNGTLIIREHKQILLIIYQCLSNILLEKIIREKNKYLAMEFIFGVLEGDGYPLPNGRGIAITFDRTSYDVLKKVFDVADIDHKISPKKQYFNIRVGALTIFENLHLWSRKLFKYYPKRRKRTIERLFTTGSAQFLLGKQSTTSAWILKRFRKKGILDEQNRLTAKGKKIRKSLQNLEKEIILSPLPT